MIVDRIENLEKYAQVIPYAKEIAKALEGDLTHDGRRDVDGNECYFTVSTVSTRSKGTAGYETHAVYADVQVVLSGTERMDLGRELKEKCGYDEKHDIQFFNGEMVASWHAIPGWFVLFFPGEAHEPLIQEKSAAMVHKVVFKIKMK